MIPFRTPTSVNQASIDQSIDQYAYQASLSSFVRRSLAPYAYFTRLRLFLYDCLVRLYFEQPLQSVCLLSNSLSVQSVSSIRTPKRQSLLQSIDGLFFSLSSVDSLFFSATSIEQKPLQPLRPNASPYSLFSHYRYQSINHGSYQKENHKAYHTSHSS